MRPRNRRRRPARDTLRGRIRMNRSWPSPGRPPAACPQEPPPRPGKPASWRGMMVGVPPPKPSRTACPSYRQPAGKFQPVVTRGAIIGVRETRTFCPPRGPFCQMGLILVEDRLGPIAASRSRHPASPRRRRGPGLRPGRPAGRPRTGAHTRRAGCRVSVDFRRPEGRPLFP